MIGAAAVLGMLKAHLGPALVYLPIRAGSLPGLGRPAITPAEVAQRFRVFASAPVAAPAEEALG